MNALASIPLMQRLEAIRPQLTPKLRELADFVMQNPGKAVFMRIRDLAGEMKVSVSTVIRFVDQLGYQGYGEFIQALRDHLDSVLGLVDRVNLSSEKREGPERLIKAVLDDIDDLRRLYDKLDFYSVNRAAESIWQAPQVYVVGARLSFFYAEILGWWLSRIRKGTRVLNGSNLTSLDWLHQAPRRTLVVMIAISRYASEMLPVARLLKRMDHPTIAIVDNTICPLIEFVDQVVVAPCRSIPIISSVTTMSCVLNCLIYAMLGNHSEEVRRHQEELEQFYNDFNIFLNPDQLSAR